ncbi:hypothetical protein ACQP1G_38135 [Nocardia sp. CA-107356]|uniref:hypothetical protein n=1 Tax=Nocardia sp. CA-107356 TaxID=3239972 RepID=UPI003D923FE2
MTSTAAGVIEAEEHIHPQFLKKSQWRTGKDIYMGLREMSMAERMPARRHVVFIDW